jgi:hypothetical protein
MGVKAVLHKLSGWLNCMSNDGSMRKAITKILPALSLLVTLLAPTSLFASDNNCCTVISQSATKVVLNCQGLNTEAQVRIEGSKAAALLRYHEAFGPSDVGTYFERNEVAVVTATITGETRPKQIALNSFVDSKGQINWLISYHTSSGKIFATSNFGNQGIRCEQTSKVISISSDEVPRGYTAVTASTTASRPDVVIARLFGAN